jgi:Flp pilus assembly protein TadD
MQIGNELRSISEFDKALECYQKAKLLDDGTKAAGIRDEIIRTSVAKGEYSVALAQYMEIPAHEIFPGTLTSLGTLYRKMGNLRPARESYRCALNASNNWNDVADAGLAEATKQAGNPHKAIAQYNRIFDQYKDSMDHSSERVYVLALSQLFRLTGQYASAIKSLEKLLEYSPLDQEANFQLAKVYMLAGDLTRAASCIKLAKVPDLTGIACELFRIAMARISPEGFVLKPSNAATLRALEAFLPEERGLAGCRDAVVAIEEERYSDVITTLNSIKFVDRIHKDFADVLVYHANRRLDSNYDFRKEKSLCRILKRGFKPLRQTARLIALNKFDSASQDELRLCIRIA